MWRKVVDPEILIYLDVSYPVSMQRRALNLSKAEYQEAVRRLSHARQHCTFYVDTDPLTPAEVLAQVLEYVRGAAQAGPSKS
jgi:hypothetical protein